MTVLQMTKAECSVITTDSYWYKYKQNITMTKDDKDTGSSINILQANDNQWKKKNAKKKENNSRKWKNQTPDFCLYVS